jgi:hypothetical protein
MVQTTFVARLMWLVIPLALAMPSAALAGNVCVRTDALGGWTFVLKKASLKPGASGAASGYAIRDDGFASPISAGFVVFESTIHVGITRYGTGLNVNSGSGGTSYTSTFHQLQANLRDSSGSDWSWTREINGTITNTSGDAALVDCKTVPAIPKVFPD